MSEEINFNNKTKNIRISGESGSPQNNLRYELYTEGYDELKKYVFNPTFSTPILRPKLGDSAGVYGAALL